MKKKLHKTHLKTMSGSMKVTALIFAMMTLFSMQVSAADYPIKIAGVTVTDANKNDVQNNGGSVKYDPATQTITLDNATINGGSGSAISISVASSTGSYTINLIGHNEIYSADRAIYGKCSSLTIQGINDGSLEMVPITVPSIGIHAYDADLIIKDCNIYAIANGSTVIAGNSVGKTITIDNANVETHSLGIDVSPIGGFSSMILTHCKMTMPANGTYTNNQIQVDGSNYYGNVNIIRVYPIVVGGVEVTEDNKNAVPIISGSATYNPDTRTLILEGDEPTQVYSNNYDGVYVSAPAEAGVEYTIWGDPEQDDYFLIQSGQGGTYDGIYSRANLALEGRLLIHGAYYGISMGNSASLAINDAGIKVDGGQTGIGGNGGDLIIENSEVKITSGGVSGFANISLVGSYIHSPAGAVVEGGAIKLDGNIYTGEIVIKKSTVYLQVGGVDVTDDNKNAVPIISGTAIYNSDTRTLMLETDGAAYVYSSSADGVYIDTPAENGVEYTIWGDSEEGDYFVIQSGQGGAYDGIYSRANLALEGRLLIDGAYYGISMGNSASLAINDAGIKVDGGQIGIGGNGGDLVIRNSEVIIESGGVSGFTNIYFFGSYIHSPAGAVREDGAIKLDGNIYTGEIVIKKSPVGVDLKEAALNNAWASSGTLYIEYNQGTKATAEVFSLLGTKVANISLSTGVNSQAMDRGIYIVRIGNETHKVSVK